MLWRFLPPKTSINIISIVLDVNFQGELNNTYILPTLQENY